jgi:hypothetical protein
MKSLEPEFICPECDSTEAATVAMVSTCEDAENAWSSVLQRISCAQCHFPIPAHLAERWDGISIEQAKQEWRQIYRSTAMKENE